MHDFMHDLNTAPSEVLEVNMCVSAMIKQVSISVSIAILAIASVGTSHSRSVAASQQLDASNRLIHLQAQNTEPSEPSGEDSTARFTCQFVDGEYIVMYSPQSQPGEQYPWAKPQTMGGGWSAERRCVEISRRLESYRPNGLLEMRTDIENGYDIVCVTTEAAPGCDIVFTVPLGQDPVLTRDRVFENLAVADSGEDTEAVSTFRGGGSGNILTQIGDELGISLPSLPGRSRTQSNGINLRPFLDPADGGTGAQLRGSHPSQPSPRLNPDQFR
jgi:hypothetical protein